MKINYKKKITNSLVLAAALPSALCAQSSLNLDQWWTQSSVVDGMTATGNGTYGINNGPSFGTTVGNGYAVGGSAASGNMSMTQTYDNEGGIQLSADGDYIKFCGNASQLLGWNPAGQLQFAGHQMGFTTSDPKDFNAWDPAATDFGSLVYNMESIGIFPNGGFSSYDEADVSISYATFGVVTQWHLNYELSIALLDASTGLFQLKAETNMGGGSSIYTDTFTDLDMVGENMYFYFGSSYDVDYDDEARSVGGQSYLNLTCSEYQGVLDTSNVPEPSSLILISLAAGSFLTSRKRR